MGSLDLTARELEVLKRRFSTSVKNPTSRKTVGQDFGVSAERIKQIETKALSKILKWVFENE